MLQPDDYLFSDFPKIAHCHTFKSKILGVANTGWCRGGWVLVLATPRIKNSAIGSTDHGDDKLLPIFRRLDRGSRRMTYPYRRYRSQRGLHDPLDIPDPIEHRLLIADCVVRLRRYT